MKDCAGRAKTRLEDAVEASIILPFSGEIHFWEKDCFSSHISLRCEAPRRIYWGDRQYAFRALNAQTYFDEQNWLGTERERTNYTGGSVNYYQSLPYGDGYLAQYPGSYGDQDNSHFTGMERDAESDTDHAMFRQYGNMQGRWMSPDPYTGSYDLGNPQSFDRYSYVMNNPVAFTDPGGLMFGCWFLCESGNLNLNAEGAAGSDLGWDIFDLLDFVVYGGYGGQWATDSTTADIVVHGWWVSFTSLLPFVNGDSPAFEDGQDAFSQSYFIGNKKSQAPNNTQHVPLFLCAARAADQLSLANAFGTSGKSGFLNSLSNGLFGNTISTVVEYAYGGSAAEFATTAYDYGTKASEGAVNAATGSAGLTDLGLGAESASQIAAESAEEGLGGPVAILKGAYDLGTFIYGAVKCY